MNWINLTDISQLADIDRLSYDKPQWIYKHSTRCIVSKIALRKLESSNLLSQQPGFFLDLIKYRNVSNTIEDHYEITHESPQILIIKNGKCIFSESHMAIDPGEMMQLLQQDSHT